MLTGVLSIGQGVSRVNGVALAICGAPDPFGAATNFIVSRGFQSRDSVSVSGASGLVGTVTVFCMSDIAAALVAALSVAARKKPAARKAAKKPAKKPAARKVAPKKAAKKKPAAKKAVRKSTRKPTARGTTVRKRGR